MKCPICDIVLVKSTINWRIGERQQINFKCNKNDYQVFGRIGPIHASVDLVIPGMQVFSYMVHCVVNNKLYRLEATLDSLFPNTGLGVSLSEIKFSNWGHGPHDIVTIPRVCPVDCGVELKPQFENIINKLKKLVVFS